MADGVQTYFAPNLDAKLTVWLYCQPHGPGTASASPLWAAAGYSPA
jgi:hypothetical protein